LPYDSWSGAGGVFAPGRRTPEYVPQCPAAAPAYSAEQAHGASLVCRPDHGRRGLCRIGSNGALSGSQCRGVVPGHAAPGAATDYGPRRAGALYRRGQPRDIPTDEHPFWSPAASRHLRAPQKGATCRHDRPGARGPAGVARRGGRMMDTYLTAFQTYLEVERQASPHTIRNYLSDLEQFVRFASERLGKAALTPDQIDATLVRDFLSTLYQQGVGHTTLARKLASLRSF